MVASIPDSLKTLFRGCEKDPDLKSAKDNLTKLEKVLEERKWQLQLLRH